MAPPDRVPEMRNRLLAAAREAAREPEDITMVYNIVIRVADAVDPRPFVVSGSPSAVAERLLGFVEIGFTAFNFILSGPDTNEQEERLAREVIPAVRAGTV
jgi:alkanesulfonate monooxygenase SsuD/methylene tetrahydromethanopterin reductase-like flavin-dependent oxidoreductase (luciferase family)